MKRENFNLDVIRLAVSPITGNFYVVRFNKNRTKMLNKRKLDYEDKVAIRFIYETMKENDEEFQKNKITQN